MPLMRPRARGLLSDYVVGVNWPLAGCSRKVHGVFVFLEDERGLMRVCVVGLRNGESERLISGARDVNGRVLLVSKKALDERFESNKTYLLQK